MENASTNVTSTTYGQEYDYRTVDMQTGDTISSGVASWEPSIGGEENPFRMPKYEIHKVKGGRDDVITHLEPAAEAFYPSPDVGYSKVTVKTIGGTTGRTVTEFYTAKDFPSRVYKTVMDKSTSDNPNFQRGSQQLQIAQTAALNTLSSQKFGLGLDLKLDYLHAQQGYTIVNNDMHGKLHRQTIYPEGSNNSKSSVEYIYQTIQEYDESTKNYETHLDNNVLTYDYTNNNAASKQVAIDYDMTYDKQAEQTITASGKLQFNVDYFLVPPAPVASISFFLGLGFQLNDFKYTSITKVINQYGILKSVKAFEDGSNIETNNLMYDDHTGEVLLTETQNEFNDKTYKLNYPAHFAYDRMGQAYRNINITLTELITNEKGALKVVRGEDNLTKSLVLGDEVVIEGISLNPYNPFKAWVHKLKSSSDFCLLDKDGNIYKNLSLFKLTVIRSGRRNMQNIPIGGLVTLKNPLVYNGFGYNLVIDSNYVLNASAQTFSDDWQTLCDHEKLAPCLTETDIGKAFKRWIYRLAKYDKFTDDVTYAGDTLVPSIFKDILFCGGAPATHYHTTHGDCTGQEYNFRNSADSTCCSFTLYSGYRIGKTHQEMRYLVMLLANNDTFYTNNGTLVNADSSESDTLTPRLKFPNEGRTSYGGSLVYTLQYINDSTVDTNHYHLFQVSHSFYDSIPLTYGSQPNVSNKYSMLEDTTEYFCISYHDTTAAHTNIISVDTNYFQTINSSYGSSAGKSFKILATLANGDKTWLQGTFGENCSFSLFEKCCTDCSPPDNRIINPYVQSVRGTWRKKADYAYNDKRVQTESGGVHSPNLRKDGVFSDFKPFWSFNTNKYTKTSNIQWKKASEVTVYNPYGNEMEDKNALGIYSSALFGYNFRLPIAVASNAKYTQIAYEGFEDYGSTFGGVGDCPFNHWSFLWSINHSYLDPGVAHSGRYSLRVPVNDSEMITRRVFNCKNVFNGVDTDQFVINACNCIKKFSPDSGEYLIGAWIKEDHTTSQSMITSYHDASIKVKLRKTCSDPDSIVYVFKASGSVIEDWQRIEGKFKIPDGYAIVEVYLVAPNQRTWFDDIRIHPFKGNMKTFAYDQASLKLMAEMDENNFATFYEYDLEGQLMRVKKETIKGIVTLKEVRSNSSNK